MSTFKERKIQGNKAEDEFQKLYPNAIRISPFSANDFDTRTRHMSVLVKYLPDFKLGNQYVEVKDSIYYSKDEFDFHKREFPDMKVFIKRKLYNIQDLQYNGPFAGSSRGSGQPYYRIDLERTYIMLAMKADM